MDGFHDPLPQKVKKSSVQAVLDGVSKAGNSLLSLLSGLLAAALILYSGYVLYDTMYTQSRAASGWDLLQYRPELIDKGAEPAAGSDLLAAVNEDYRAWVTLYETGIDYPVMQGPDDLYYATHDIYGGVSLTGAIYLAAANSRGFTDSYNLLYGHHMDNGAMFGCLDAYTDESYVLAHREGVLISASGVYDLYVFAVAATDAYESQIYTVGDRAPELLAFLESAASGKETTQMYFYDAKTASGAEKVLALSTCAAANTDGRLVVFATMTRHNMMELRAVGYGDTYDAKPHGLRDIWTNYPEGTTFYYSTDGGKTWSQTPPTRTDVGTTTVIVRAVNPIYGESETTEIIQVNPAPVTVTVLDATKAAGEQDPAFRAVVTGLLDDFRIVYSISRPGVGTDEDEGSYPGAIIAEGEEFQGNYRVTYVPGTLTITAAQAAEELEPVIAAIVEPFQPRGMAEGGGAWALVNLICLLVTAYLFLPFGHLKAKFGRIKAMKSFNGEKAALLETEELDERQRAERLLIEQAAALALEKLGGTDMTEGIVAQAVEDLFYHVRSFANRFRAGFALELITAVAALVAFVLTEDMRQPMTLIDKWTPLMLLLALACWGLDVGLMRYRNKLKAEEELANQQESAGPAAQ